MADEWYYSSDKQKHGPCTAAHLKECAALGKILPTDTVWKAGVEKGVLASRVEHLFAGTGRLPPQVPVAPPPVMEIEAILAYAAPTALPSLLESVEMEESLVGADVTDDIVEGAVEPIIPDGLELKSMYEESENPAPGSAAASLQASAAPSPPKVEAPKPAKAPPPTHRKMRVVAMEGAVILSQDGDIVRYRKKCGKCNKEDDSRATMHVRQGTNRAQYFCPKCRKRQSVIIQGNS